MAKFEGVRWADVQICHTLSDRNTVAVAANDKVFAVSRSIHYGLFLCFEGIRFFARRSEGRLELVFLNWHRNLERFQRGIAFGLGKDQQRFVPTVAELEKLIIEDYFGRPEMKAFLEEMADMGAQGYLRPFTVDEEQSIGVTHPAQPSIRILACRYDRYLGEPFTGVVVPGLVRAVGVNGTGCLKLGGNYVMSVKAVDAAREVVPDAAAALFLDDNVHGRLEDRAVTEWDSSCALFALTDGTVVKIPEGPLLLPSVTIQGITAILRSMGVKVEERPMTYGELVQRVQGGTLAAVASVGTAGILNRAQRLVLVDGENRITGEYRADETNALYQQLAEAKRRYWDVYRGESPVVEGLSLSRYQV